MDEKTEYYKILDWLSANMPDEVNDPARGDKTLSNVVIRLLEELDANRAFVKLYMHYIAK